MYYGTVRGWQIILPLHPLSQNHQEHQIVFPPRLHHNERSGVWGERVREGFSIRQTRWYSDGHIDSWRDLWVSGSSEASSSNWGWETISNQSNPETAESRGMPKCESWGAVLKEHLRRAKEESGHRNRAPRQPPVYCSGWANFGIGQPQRIQNY